MPGRRSIIAAAGRVPGRALGLATRAGEGDGVMLLGFVAYYYLRVGDGAHLVVLSGMLIGIPGNVLLGTGLLRSRFRPRFAACVILLDLPLSIALVSISTQALGMWTMTLAWGVIGWSLWRDSSGAGGDGVRDHRRAARTASPG